jgi:hypothetical protein
MKKNIGKRPQGRPKRKWKDNIKVHFNETGFGNVDYNYL